MTSEKLFGIASLIYVVRQSIASSKAAKLLSSDELDQMVYNHCLKQLTGGSGLAK